jgi:hypothetical protein
MRPLPNDLREAFYEVVAQHLCDWRGSPPEPEVLLNRECHTISEICRLVDVDELGKMPDHLVELICAQADGTFDPLFDRTFQGGARYVLEIIERRKRAFEAKHHR